MKRLQIFCICLSLMATAATADSGIIFGIKGGIVDNYGQPGLNLSTYDISQMNLIGGQFHIATLPVVDLIVGADYSWHKQTLSIAGQSLPFKMRDLAITASLVYPIQLGPAKLYGGGGIGSHSISYEYLRPVSLSLAANGVSIPETSAFFGYHALAGAEIGLSGIPLGVFVEGRINRVNIPEENIKFNSFAGGVYLSLP